MSDTTLIAKSELLALTADIVSAHVSNNPVPPADLTGVIESVFAKLTDLAADKPEPQEELIPAVPVKKSVTDEFIVCLEDGKKLKMLKRHLKTAYDMTPEEYRAKWGLSADYPMVAPAYSRRRSQFAKDIGLGRGGRKKRASK